MNMKTKRKIWSYIGLGCIGGSLALSSCSLDIPLEDQYADPDAITTVENARSLLTSAYVYYPHTEYELSVLGPDFCPTSLTGKDSEQKNLYYWQDNAISKFSQQLWLDLYNVISICDLLQERLDKVAVENEERRRQLDAVAAESYAMEALCYFNLLRLFAPAYAANPQADGIILKNRVGVEFPRRSSIEDCVAQIRLLLQKAADVENAPERNGWLSQTAVHYLQAELELYAGNYALAAELAEGLIRKADPSYFAADGYARLWEPGSYAGRIFGFNVTAPVYVSLQYDAREGDYFAVAPEVAFGAADYRARYSLYPFEMDGSVRQLLGKYNRNNKENRKNDYLNVMRFAGAYFICAEAYSHLPGQSGKARNCINAYLACCGADLLPEQLEGDRLADAILKEKLKEFVGEGVAYFDWKRRGGTALPRWNRWGKGTVGTVEAADYRWTFPIPASEYKNNDNVTQNEGWPINR